MRASRWHALALALVLAVVPWCALAQGLLQVPALTARVIDQTGMLAPDARAALEAKLAAFEAEAGPQIVVLLVHTTQPEDIAAYAYRVADTWKIGRRDVGDGVLVVVAKNDRRLRIEVAKALEGAVPDLAARQIIQNAISPAFKAGDYAGGLDQGLDQLIARIKGEHLPAPAPRQGDGARGAGPQLQELLMFFFVAVPIVGAVLSRIFGRKLGALLTGGGAGGLGGWLTHSLALGIAAGVVAAVLVGIVGVGSALRRAGVPYRGRRGGDIVWGGGGWGAGRGSGGFGGGFGGGGFSSGGGGDFGGGGASGDW
jgi:uncharacterized protein